MPDVSVVICTYNREKYLKKTLEHLTNQSYPIEEYEVVIVNNKSTDDTEGICHSFIASHTEFQISYFREEEQGLTYSRNRGIKESKADIIAFLDDDAFAQKDYVQNIVLFFEGYSQVAAIGGKIEPEYESKEPAWMSKYLWPLVAAQDLGDQIKPFAKNKFPIGANMVFRKSAFKTHGVFNPELGRRGAILEGGEEKDMIFRIRNAGEEIYYVPNIMVRHVIPDKRLSMGYIKGMAVGVASSEKKRLSSTNVSLKAGKVLEELIKIGGTCVLALIYFLSFKIAKASMLLKFRWWVTKGYFSKVK